MARRRAKIPKWLRPTRGEFSFGKRKKRGEFTFEPSKLPKTQQPRRTPLQRGAPREPEQLPEDIQGKPRESKENARAAIALGIIGYRYRFAVPYFGGRGQPGGTEVEFIVETPGLPTPLYVQSTFFHLIKRNAQARDRFIQARLRLIPGLAPAKEIWDWQLRTIDDAVRNLTLILGRS